MMILVVTTLSFIMKQPLKISSVFDYSETEDIRVSLIVRLTIDEDAPGDYRDHII